MVCALVLFCSVLFSFVLSFILFLSCASLFRTTYDSVYVEVLFLLFTVSLLKCIIKKNEDRPDTFFLFWFYNSFPPIDFHTGRIRCEKEFDSSPKRHCALVLILTQKYTHSTHFLQHNNIEMKCAQTHY